MNGMIRMNRASGPKHGYREARRSEKANALIIVAVVMLLVLMPPVSAGVLAGHCAAGTQAANGQAAFGWIDVAYGAEAEDENDSGEVVTTGEPTGAADTVYVAGNPDWYPVEYYDEETEAYEGILPEILKEISQRTGLRFTYIAAGEEDQRARLAKHGQVELISGLQKGDPQLQEEHLTESSAILRMNRDGAGTEVCFAFTHIADETLIADMENALSAISGQEIAGIAANFAAGQEAQNCPVWLIAAAAGVFILLAAGCIALLIRLRHYRKEADRDKLFDPSTGIGNKEYFIRQFEAYISDQYRAIYCVLYVGFDIERVNSYYGEMESENMLYFAANELMKSVAENDIAARVSGGGFAIAHPCSGQTEAEKWAKELLRRLNRYTEKFGKDYHPDFYGGLYMMKQTDRDGETVLFNARQGYQHAVKQHVDCAFAHEVFLRDENQKMQLKKQTCDALQNREFQMFLQFIVAARDGRIISAESLSRWNHPQKGLLRPGSYIELMEEENTIAQLDFYIFEEACRQLECWAKEGRAISISCNFTRITINHENFLSTIQNVAGKYFFDHQKLIIEITEDVMEIDKENAFDNISGCKRMGFRIALDDAGSGYTSFSDLRDYPIDIVKIDRSILTSAVDEKGISLLKGMIMLVHTMGMEVLCEGVETGQQVELLRQLQCDYMQGYYFFRPLPKEEAEQVMNEARIKDET